MESEKEVDFYTYCEKCEYKKIEEWDVPCNDCLCVPVREGTCKPLYFKERAK